MLGKLIVIEGNIGSGKSTYVEILEKEYLKTLKKDEKPKVYFAKQKIENWYYLPKFYENQSKYCFQLQMEIWSSYREIMKLRKQFEIVVMEGHPHTTLHTFVATLKEKKNFDSKQLAIIQNCYYHQCDFTQNDFEHPDIIINILTTDLNINLKRIIKRGREFEKNINLEYLSDIQFHMDKTHISCIFECEKKITMIQTYNDSDNIGYIEYYCRNFIQKYF